MSATQPTQRIRNADRTIRLLKSATRAQLIGRGFASLSIQSILQEAGVSKGALFHHFPSKDHLVAAAFEEVLIEFARRFDDTSKELRAGRQTKQQFIEKVTAIVESDLFVGCMEIALGVRTEEALSQLTANAVSDWRDAFFRFWGDTFELRDRSAEEIRTHWALASNAIRGHAFSFSFGGTKEARAMFVQGFLAHFLVDASIRPPNANSKN